MCGGPRQRAIVLGDNGQRIKSIGARARAELERLLERRVHLFLFVKVRDNWIEDPERFAALGLDYQCLDRSADRATMQWTDTASCSATRRHGENALIVELLTRERGRHAGLVRGGSRRAGARCCSPATRSPRLGAAASPSISARSIAS